MLTSFADGGLELRRKSDGSVRIAGRFPYGQRAVLSDGGRTGRPRKEVIAPRAFAYRVDRPDEDIHFLAGHSYDKPLASRGAGTLSLTDSDDALTFTAIIAPELQEAGYVRDFLAGLGAGLVLGLSPGFRIPPKRAVAQAETVEDEGSDPENGMHNAIIRTVHAALLYELSAVTRAAYSDAQIEARNWETGAGASPLITPNVHKRWRR